MVIHQLQVRCRPGKVRWSETDVLQLSFSLVFCCRGASVLPGACCQSYEVHLWLPQRQQVVVVVVVEVVTVVVVIIRSCFNGAGR